MTLYSDPKKQAKLEEAISLGLIIRTKEADGVYKYQLTQKGLHQWMFERAQS